jgi:YggT family protein
MSILVIALTRLCSIMSWLIIIRALMSWVHLSGKFWSDLHRTLEALTEPLLAPIRNVLPGGGMGLDWSPLIALILLQVVERVIISLFYGLL